MEGGDVGPNDNGARSESQPDSHRADAALPEREKLEKVVIRFAGDSGDGMQLTGDRFTSEAALFGNDLATQPNYPAEIRAPQGTLPGVSSFQIQIADYDILTAGELHAVAGVPGETDDDLFQLFPFGQRRIGSV